MTEVWEATTTPDTCTAYIPDGRRHGTFKAWKSKCRCPGQGQELFPAYAEKERVRKRGSVRVHVEEGSVEAPDFYSPAVPEPTHEATQVQRALLLRRDLACRDEPLNLFYPSTRGPAARRELAEAKQVCGRCPGIDLCLTWALQIHDDSAVLGGTSPDERRQLRARGWVA